MRLFERPALALVHEEGLVCDLGVLGVLFDEVEAVDAVGFDTAVEMDGGGKDGAEDAAVFGEPPAGVEVGGAGGEGREGEG